MLKYGAVIELLSAEISTLEEYKIKLISDVVTGKIDARGIEIPDYEYVGETSDIIPDEDDLEEQNGGIDE